jgi:AraC-like DNA-binding protein
MKQGDRTVFSTDMVPERRRAEWWREHICEAMGNVTIEWLTDAPIQAHIALSRFGGSSVYQVGGAPRRIARDPTKLARVSGEAVYLMLRQSGRACYRQGGHEIVHEAGDLALGDSTLPYEVLHPDDGEFLAWELPQSKLAALLATRGEPFVTHISGRHGMGSLLSTYLGSLWKEADHLSPEMQVQLHDQLCQLVALALGPSPEGRERSREAYRGARLRQALDYIERHLTDSDLSADRVAGHLRMSTRSLQRLFEMTGTSFARWTQQRRIETCRQLLIAPRDERRSVADIAYSCGFNDVSAFYRAFRAHFAMTPRELRQQHAELDRMRLSLPGPKGG